MIYQLVFGVTLFFRINDKKDTFSVSVFSLSIVQLSRFFVFCLSDSSFTLSHLFLFVKNFFQKFLKLASTISAATILGYHILWLLSSVFFISLCGAVLTAPTALLEYQIIPHLSTPFFNFF